MSTATWGAAATNGLHNKVAHPEEYMAPLDDVVAGVTQRLHDSIWSPWGATALVGVGALLLFYSMSGRMSSVTSAAAWALLVLAIVAGMASTPPGSPPSSTARSPRASRRSARRQRADQPARLVRPCTRPGRLGGRPRPLRQLAARRARLHRLRARPRSGARTCSRPAPSPGRKPARRTDPEQASGSPKEGRELEEDRRRDPGAGPRRLRLPAGQGPAVAPGTGVMVALGSSFTCCSGWSPTSSSSPAWSCCGCWSCCSPPSPSSASWPPWPRSCAASFNMAGAPVVNVVAFSAGAAVHTTVISAPAVPRHQGGMGLLGLVLCLVSTIAAFILLFPCCRFTNILGHSGRSTLGQTWRA